MITIPTLVDALAHKWPNIKWTAAGDPNVYSNILSSDTLPTEAEIVAVRVDLVKSHVIDELSAQCEASIENGFISDALGTPHYYDSQIVDQINLIGAYIMSSASGQPMPYATRDLETMVKHYVPHSPEQMSKVLADGTAWKLQHLTKFHMKRAYVNGLSDITAILAVTWDSIEPTTS